MDEDITFYKQELSRLICEVSHYKRLLREASTLLAKSKAFPKRVNCIESDQEIYTVYKCPECGFSYGPYGLREINYCSNCGQHLFWGTEEEYIERYSDVLLKESD